MSGPTLIIGNKNYSSWSLRPWLFMRQNHIDFTEKCVPLYTPDSDAELEKYGSDYKVPILLDGDLVVWDSLAILEYLSEQHLDGAGWPPDPAARAIARSISSEMHSSYVNVRHEMPMNVRKQFPGVTLSPAAEREVLRIVQLWQRCRREFGQEGEWLFGHFSIADAMFAPIALRLHGYNVPLQAVERDYVHTILNQPAIQEWIEAGKLEAEIIEDAELKI